MSDTTYVDYVAPAVSAEWLNEINDHVWHDTPVIGSTIHNASAIKNTPNGTIEATNVQAAINEIVSDLSNDSGSSLIGFIQAGIGSVQRTIQDKAREFISVTDFGAVGDGVTDDTAAIQAAITATNAAGGGTVNFMPGKTYIVTPRAATSFILQNRSNVRLQGNGGSTLKVKSGSGDYLGILGVDGGNPAVFNMTVDGMTFDHNTEGNPLTTLINIQTYTRSTFAVWQGRNIRFTNNTVKNDSSMLAIDINGDAVSDIFIQFNKFLNCGMASNAIDHDHSTIYIMADNVDISHNQFSTDWINLSCRTAIETHGSRYAVSNNVISGYICGIIATGIYGTDSTQQTITDNSITSRAQGIIVWSRTWGAKTTGYGIEGVLISDNLINIKQASYFSGGDVVMGIGIYPNATLGVKSMHVWDNKIEFEPEDSTPAYTTNAKNAGLGWNLDIITLPMVDCSFKGNRVINAPVMGLGLVGGNFANVEVSGNTLINCARSVAPTAGDLRFPMTYLPNTATVNFFISRNRIIDTVPTTRFRAAMFFAAQTAGTKCECTDNDISIEGSVTTAFTRTHEIDASNNIIPLIKDTSNMDMLPVGSVLDGSTMTGKTNSRTYRRIGSLWLARYWSDVIPTASGNKGDYAENRLKTVGQPKGWYCTGGTTWVSEGNL